MSPIIAGAMIIAAAIVASVALSIYFDAYHSCVRFGAHPAVCVGGGLRR